MINGIQPPGGFNPSQFGQVKERIFTKADADGDGSISKVEFGEQLSAKGVSSDRIDNMFSRIDSSGDGSISIEESSAALDEMKSRMESMMSSMRSIGRGGDPSLSLLESLEQSSDESDNDDDPHAQLRSYLDELKRSGAGSAGNFFNASV